MLQEGALFGSMSLYGNTAFPLREHTKKKEFEAHSIVMENDVRLRRCSTSMCGWNRSPNSKPRRRLLLPAQNDPLFGQMS